MADNFKTFYIAVARFKDAPHKGSWGKGISLKTALSLCNVRRLTDRFVIYQAIIKDSASNEQVENLCKCFNVDDLGGVNLYSNPTGEDLVMIKEYLLGWITNEDFIY
jgi:hypothetical protein